MTTRLGDLFALGRHGLLCGDALLAQSYVTLLEGRRVRTIVSDPPFDRKPSTIGGTGKIKHGAFVQGSGELGEAFRPFCATFMGEMKAHALPGALVYLFIDPEHTQLLLEAAQDAGLRLRTIGVWDKGRGGQGAGLYRSAHELVPIFSVDAADPVFNVKQGRYGRDRLNIFRYAGATTPGSSARKMLSEHPTPKSVEMIVDFMLDASNPEDIVLDSFICSGTLFIAAERSRSTELPGNPRTSRTLPSLVVRLS